MRCSKRHMEKLADKIRKRTASPDEPMKWRVCLVYHELKKLGGRQHLIGCLYV